MKLIRAQPINTDNMSNYERNQIISRKLSRIFSSAYFYAAVKGAPIRGTGTLGGNLPIGLNYLPM